MARGGGVDDDEVGGLGPFERLDLPEDEDLLHSRDGRGDDVEHARIRQPAGEPAQAPLLQVLQEGLVRRHGAGGDSGRDLEFLVDERLGAEGRREPRFAFDLDDQHARARTGGSGRQCRGDSGLPDAALACHDHDPGSGAELRELHRPHATGATATRLSPLRLSRQLPLRPARRRLRGARLLAALLAVAAGAVGVSDALAGASAPAARPGHRGIDVVEVQGLLDPPTASLVLDSIANANRTGATMLVLRLDSKGAVDTDPSQIVRAIERSKVPVVVWVGPSGARAEARRPCCSRPRHKAFVAPGSDVGPADPVNLDTPDEPGRAAVAADLARLARARHRNVGGVTRLTSHSMSANEAQRAGAIDGIRPTIGEVIVTLDGKTIQTAGGPVKLSTAKVVGHGTGRRRQPNQQVVFDSLSLGARVQHSLISPSLAYFLFLAGLALIVFEFFACSVGFAGAVGALAMIGGFYGFSHLPVAWWGLLLLVVAEFGLSIDVQAGGLGVWTIIGSACSSRARSRSTTGHRAWTRCGG